VLADADPLGECTSAGSFAVPEAEGGSSGATGVLGLAGCTLIGGMAALLILTCGLGFGCATLGSGDAAAGCLTAPPCKPPVGGNSTIRTSAGASSGGGGAVLSSNSANTVSNVVHKISEHGTTQANRSRGSSM
jgi:hypothetical protein